jgi:multiple sugar transport system permease protein
MTTDIDSPADAGGPLRRSALAALTFVILAAVLMPIVWMVFASVRPTAETLAVPPVWFPRQISFAAYAKLLSDPNQLSYFINTYVIAGSTALFSTAIGAFAAYGFSRFRLRGSRALLVLILLLQILPPVSLILPYFNMARAFGLYNTHLALIFANTAFALPVSVWMLKNYLDSVPAELEEAAMIDGCSRMQAFRIIVLPLALPGIIGTAAFAFLSAWNEFLFAVVLTVGPDAAPLTIAISQFFTQYGRDWNAIMALNVVATVPLFLIFVFLQRWVVQGMTAGALK